MIDWPIDYSPTYASPIEDPGFLLAIFFIEHYLPPILPAQFSNVLINNTPDLSYHAILVNASFKARCKQSIPLRRFNEISIHIIFQGPHSTSHQIIFRQSIPNSLDRGSNASMGPVPSPLLPCAPKQACGMVSWYRRCKGLRARTYYQYNHLPARPACTVVREIPSLGLTVRPLALHLFLTIVAIPFCYAGSLSAARSNDDEHGKEEAYRLF